MILTLRDGSVLTLSLQSEDLDLRQPGDTLTGDTLVRSTQAWSKVNERHKALLELLSGGDEIRVVAAIQVLDLYWSSKSTMTPQQKQQRKRLESCTGDDLHCLELIKLSKTECTRILRSLLSFIPRDDRDLFVKNLYTI